MPPAASTPRRRRSLPEMERWKVYVVARIWLAIHLAVIALAIVHRLMLPVMYVGILPSVYGGWLYLVFGLTQHAGLAEDVLDHRLNARTVYMNPIFRFLYWNMNYHVEHHMFPMVPYHALPELHEVMKADTPTPYASTIEAYREIIPALLRQEKRPRVVREARTAAFGETIPSRTARTGHRLGGGIGRE